MNTKETEFFQKLLATFRIEAEENLKSIITGLLELENTVDQETQLRLTEQVFREAHSLKGAARAVNKRDVETIFQAIESVFSALKQRTLPLSPAVFDTLHRTLDAVDSLLDLPEGESLPETVIEMVEEVEHLLDNKTDDLLLPPMAPFQIKPAAPPPKEIPPVAEPTPNLWPPPASIAPPAEMQPSPPKEKPPALPAPARATSGDTVRISTAKLDNLLLQAEELLSVKLATNQHVTDLQNIMDMLDIWQKEWSKTSPEVQRLSGPGGAQRTPSGSQPAPAKLLDFLIWNQEHMDVLIGQLQTLTKSIAQQSHTAGGMIDNLLEDVKKSLMLPFSTLLDTFPKMVRDLSRAQEKEVALTIKGGEVEIDRRILEEVKTPLIHILRNSVDHGLEKPAIRAKYNKPAQGKIMISVSQLDAGKVEITISDDGAGINLDNLKAAAIRHGDITPQEAAAMSTQEAMSLMYHSAVSTSTIITDISGRGLGMAIVREKIEGLGGKIDIISTRYQGASFQILLPVMVATFRGVLVKVHQFTFVIPTAGVERVLRVKQDEISLVQNREVIHLEERAVPLVQLAGVLELPPPQTNADHSPQKQTYRQIVIVGATDRRKAFVVDQIIKEQEVLVKQLGKQLARVRNVAGATVLGSGQVVPILHVPDMLKSAERVWAGQGQSPETAKEADKLQQSILIAEDSITSRMLLKNILEGAGYRVRATVDGIDALTALKTERVDLLVSDIEMPRMDGFELTAKIRADQKLANLPIILVTSLGSPEDRERGIDAGADAYLTKSSFDQTNLLSIIRRLI